jgi:serine phosphatase RsbU (regulator of sigma subunit)
MSGAVAALANRMRWWHRFARSGRSGMRSAGTGSRSEDSGARSAGLAWLAVPLLLIVTIPVADHFLPADVHLAHLLVVAMAITAAIAGPRITALVGSLAVAAIVIAGADRQTLTTESVLVEIGSLVLLSVLLVAFSSYRDRRHRELMRVRRVSDATQGVLLRPLPKRSGPVSIASAYRAFDKDSKIGGDLYAVTRTRGSTRLVIGDVRGKGLASISDNAAMLGAFRALAHRQLPLPELVTYLEGAVRWDATENAGSAIDIGERFVTAVLADIPDHEPVVHLISCGHPAPLLLHGTTATALEVPEPAPPLGLGWLSGKPYVPATFRFGEDDRLLLYTDGVTETRDRKGVFYPLAERVAAWTDETPAELVEAITDDLLAYAAAPLKDDMALVVVRREEPAGAA